MFRSTRTLALVLILLLLSAPPAQADPREELLRLAPPDAALLLVVHNAREHARNLAESPFGTWFPTTAAGQQLFSNGAFGRFRDAANRVIDSLGTSPAVVLDDVLGDAIAFAYSPAPADRPNDERAVILVRPGKPQTLAALVSRVNQLQTQTGELTAVVRRQSAGAEFFERQKADGSRDFYCFCGNVFAFSGAEADVRAVLERDREHERVRQHKPERDRDHQPGREQTGREQKRDPAAAAGKPPELLTRLRQLRVESAAAVLLVNPRRLDADVAARLAAAPEQERRFLAKFAEVWSSLDCAAVSVSCDSHLELGVSLRFQPQKVPAALKPWLVGPHADHAAANLIPRNALFGLASHARASELLELLEALAPTAPDKPTVKNWFADTIGPVVGRNNLPVLLDSLGPDWAAWAEPPAPGTSLPTLVAVVPLTGEGEPRRRAERALLQAVEFGFTAARVGYNARHSDQIELREETDPATGLLVKSLLNDRGFPPGFRPSFALSRGHLVLATHPEAVRRFSPPEPAAPPPRGSATLATLSGTACRAYLRTHGRDLVKVLAPLVAADEMDLTADLTALAAVLELIDSAELNRHELENGTRFALRLKTARPLKK